VTDVHVYPGETIIGTPHVYVNGAESITTSTIVQGANIITLSIDPVHNEYPANPLTNYDSHIASGDELLKIEYYAPASETSDPSAVVGESITVKSGESSQNVPTSSVMDISSYLKGGSTALYFPAVEGTFHYKLVVTYA
jgi:hypothetical protein